MPRIPPLPESDATDRTEQTYGRIKEMLGVDAVPEPFLYYGSVEPFLRDFYMNFKKFVFSDGKLDAKTKAAIALAVSADRDCETWTAYFIERSRELGFEEPQVAEIMAVASTNAMYNTFFKFRSIAGTEAFDGMSVGLRAHTFGNTSLDEKTVELINICISDINACQPCTSGHVKAARQLGLDDEAILEAVQCAATMAAGVQFLKAARVE
jgi:alkyl hydroperoxide reductase subunit D